MAKIAFRKQKKMANYKPTANERQDIETLAYQFFIERGGQHGFDREDWAKAEAIVKSRRS